jgi:hypothetical protein
MAKYFITLNMVVNITQPYSMGVASSEATSIWAYEASLASDVVSGSG